MHDEADLQLINLLQISPRITWARAGEILGLSGPTVAHRWQRLSAAGLAWITTHPNVERHFSALVEIDCRTKYLPAVIQELCAHPLIVSVDETTGTRDLLATIISPTMSELTRLIIDWIGGLEGVYGTRSSLITDVISGTDAWRMNMLSRRQARAAMTTDPVERSSTQRSALDLALSAALARDGRASVATLARELNVPATTVNRHLHSLVASRQLIMRCDVAPELAGWQLECTWMTTVALSHKPRVVELLRGQPTLRSSLWLTGAHNLVLNFRVVDIASFSTIESVIATTLPGLSIAETIIHLRSHKSMGWLLDAQGRTSGEVVVPDFGPQAHQG